MVKVTELTHFSGSGGNSRRKNGQRSQRARRHPPTLLEKVSDQ